MRRRARCTSARSPFARRLSAPPSNVAASLNNLAIDVRDLGDHAAAWWLLERVLAIWEKSFGPDHPNIAVACQNLAAILVDLDDGRGPPATR